MTAEVRLGDHCSVQSSKRVFAREYVERGVPFFRSKDVIDKALGSFTGYDLFIPEERFRQLKAQTGCPQKGDLLINSVGNRTGQSYIVGDEGDFYFKDGNILWLDRFDGIDPHWLSYWMKSKVGQDALASIMIGSAQKALTIDGLRKLWLRLPSLKEQTGAAALLRCLDDKIELNRRMNETLEEMARALFRDWFVDFGPTRRQADVTTDPVAIMGKAFPPEKAATLAPLFPAKLGDDGLPEGWGTSLLSERYNISIGRTPPRKEKWHFRADGKGVPWLSIRDLGSCGSFAFDTAETLEESSVVSKRVPIVDTDTVLVSFKLTVGRVAIAAKPMATNEAIAHLKVTEKSAPKEFTYSWMKQFDYGALGSTSSIATAVNSKTIRSMPILCPGQELESAFAKVAGPLLAKIKGNQQENQTLAEIRDLLLPKLMSGEIRLKDAEAAV